MDSKIRDIAHNQCSHEVDLPRKRCRICGKRIDIYEIPVDPFHIEGIFQIRSNYVLPEEERVYVKGRDWTVC